MNVSNAVHNLTMINHLNFVMKTVETGKNLPSNVMMETMKMEMDVLKIVR